MSRSEGIGPGLASPIRNAVRGTWTLPAFLVRHAWRNRGIERSETEIDRLSVDPPEHRSHDRLQPRSAGVGPVVMRTYSVEIVDAVLGPDELFEEFRVDPNHLTSNLVAAFVVEDHPARNLSEGDEVVVELPGPWNGPCTLEVVGDRRVVMATLEGHMEAGHIAFEVVGGDDDPTRYAFRVRSWARAGDAGFAALHLALPLGKELQTAMWCAMCERAVVVSGGRVDGPISVVTERLRGSSRDASGTGGARR